MSLKKENILKKLYELGFDDIGIANIDTMVLRLVVQLILLLNIIN